MTQETTTIQETREVCTMCGGRGQEFSNYSSSSTTMTCRACNGTGQKLVKTVITKTIIDTDAIADAVVEKLSKRVSQQKPHEFRALPASMSMSK